MGAVAPERCKSLIQKPYALKSDVGLAGDCAAFLHGDLEGRWAVALACCCAMNPSEILYPEVKYNVPAACPVRECTHETGPVCVFGGGPVC